MSHLFTYTYVDACAGSRRTKSSQVRCMYVRNPIRCSPPNFVTEPQSTMESNTLPMLAECCWLVAAAKLKSIVRASPGYVYVIKLSGTHDRRPASNNSKHSKHAYVHHDYANIGKHSRLTPPTNTTSTTQTRHDNGG